MGEQVWDCSCGFNYFWCPRDIKRIESWIETMEGARNEAIRYAKDSAEASLATAKDCRRVVFEVNVKQNSTITLIDFMQRQGIKISWGLCYL